MTTTVRITAHCSADKEVKVTIGDGVNPPELWTLQDGQEHEWYVYDDRALTVREVVKPAPIEPEAV